MDKTLFFLIWSQVAFYIYSHHCQYVILFAEISKSVCSYIASHICDPIWQNQLYSKNTYSRYSYIACPVCAIQILFVY